ncbi:MAG: hypothetical protein WCA91_16590 [Candidatus Acidiferrales bacterium]
MKHPTYMIVPAFLALLFAGACPDQTFAQNSARDHPPKKAADTGTDPRTAGSWYFAISGDSHFYMRDVFVRSTGAPMAVCCRDGL